MDVKQFKLDTGEEIIGQVLEYVDEDDSIIMKNVCKIHHTRTKSGWPFYTLRPFMLFQKNMEDLIVISGYHVVATANPPEMLIEQWRWSLKDLKGLLLERDKKMQEVADFEKDTRSQQQDIKRKTSKLTEEQLDKVYGELEDWEKKYINKVLDNVKKDLEIEKKIEEDIQESNLDNILYFPTVDPDPDKIH